MRNQHNQPLNQESDEQIVINYAIHTHPMTQLKTPDLLDEQKDSLFEITCQILYAALPLILCFQLTIMPMIINLYLIGMCTLSQATTTRTPYRWQLWGWAQYWPIFSGTSLYKAWQWVSPLCAPTSKTRRKSVTCTRRPLASTSSSASSSRPFSTSAIKSSSDQATMSSQSGWPPNTYGLWCLPSTYTRSTTPQGTTYNPKK